MRAGSFSVVKWASLVTTSFRGPSAVPLQPTLSQKLCASRRGIHRSSTCQMGKRPTEKATDGPRKRRALSPKLHKYLPPVVLAL
eukprot:8158093-Alexandrium_andersonii.AAC.1